MTQEQRNWNIALAEEGMPAELPSLFEEFDTLPDETSSELEKAGVDPGTDACTFIEMNGRNIFCTGEQHV